MTSRVNFAAACAAIFLAACGGGGGSGPTPVQAADTTQADPRLAQFVGHWVGCWATSASTTEKDDVHIAYVGGATLKVTRVYNQFSGSTDCTGTPWLLNEEESQVTLSGETMTLEGLTLEKFNRTGTRTQYVQDTSGLTDATHPVVHELADKFSGVVIPGNPATMRWGDSSALDAQGLPTQLTPITYQKQPS